MKKITIPQLLEKYSFVRWDRFIETDGELFIYGWIKRKDTHKDFILLIVNKQTGKFKVITSSAKRHKEIFSIIDVHKSPNCQRIENKWQIVNSIKKRNI